MLKNQCIIGVCESILAMMSCKLMYMKSLSFNRIKYGLNFRIYKNDDL